VFSVDLAGHGKLGYGFASADELDEEEVKGKVRKMLDTRHIRPHRYIEGTPNVVLAKRKDGQWRIAIIDQGPSSATPRGE
jgi:hypothetical protein